MKTDVLYQPAFALARCAIEPGEQLRAEAGAMVAMSSNIEIQTSATGGMLKSLKRSFLGGESFFMNTFTAADGPGEILFGAALPGDVRVLDVSPGPLMVQSGAFLVAEMDVNVDTKFSGGRGFFATGGLFMLRLEGRGQAVIASYGALHEMRLAAGQRYTIDTGHVVGFDANMPYNLRRVGGLKSTLFSGEGFVIDIEGPGSVLLQTRSQDAFLSWLVPQLPKNGGSSAT
ncbi:MAG TPA: TIGR00266 family protein [Thermomicrobiales bacterium]|nr:TIGR00266 family protein [Thermomicrobiales bacterium]